MRLATYIQLNAEDIMAPWEEFASTLTPAADDMSSLALRNHIKEMLAFIAQDIETPQSESEQVRKSRGEKIKTALHSAAETHAALRLAAGFSMEQMVSEFRALRASVIRLWQEQMPETTIVDLEDVTRFHESMDQQLAESVRHYSKKIHDSRDLFLGVLSHDLRNPLGSIIMAAKLTSNIGALNERQTMLTSQIVDSACRATEIVAYLLDLARARLGSGLPIVKESMNMGFVSRQVVDEMRALYPRREFRLDVAGDLDGEWDKARIGQVFSNLLGNAVRYGFTDSVIKVKVDGNGKDIVVAVHNEGVPIPAAAIGGIFDALTRTEVQIDGENQSESTSLGLGLYIAKEVVTAHSGTIDVTSTEKEGTTFTARFPRPAGVIPFSTDKAKPARLKAV